MEHFTPKFRRNPNAKIESLYQGVASGGRTVTAIVKPSAYRNSMEKTLVYGPGIPRGQGGMVASIVLGGMETSLDEMEYILEGMREKKFVPNHTGGQVAQMCRALMERRNDRIRYLRKNPSEAPKPKPKGTVRLYLPRGYRFMQTPEPGFKIAVRV